MGGRVVGRYELFDAVASGGMATVHIGRLHAAAGFSRTVAIKRLQPHLAEDPEFSSMFVDEARLASRIAHPNVVQTLDVVHTDGELLLVMEYVRGESLAKLVKLSAKAIPAEIAVGIMLGALHGLHAAHEATDEQGRALGLVHRDVSPQNIMIGTDGVARILDFGVAKASGRVHSTREGTIKGKLAYMAPEQIELDEVDRRADVYAASVVLWETLTGARLFGGETEAAVAARILAGTVRAPSAIRADLARFDDVVMRGLARAPKDRWATAREMSSALAKCTQGASQIEIGEFVATVAGERLAKNASRLAMIESSPNLRAEAAAALASVGQKTRDDGSDIEAATQAATVSVAKPVGRDRRVVAAVAAGALAVFVIGTAAIVTVARRAKPPVTEQPLGEAAQPPPSTAPVAVDIDDAPPAIPSASSSSSSSSPAAPGPTPVSTTSGAARRSGPRGSCYTMDAKGITHVKPHCL